MAPTRFSGRAPPGTPRYFNNTTQTTLTAITTGAGLGPMVDNLVTDMVTILTIDPILDACRNGALSLAPIGTAGNVPKMAAAGASFSVGTNVPCLGTGATGTWIVGDGTQGQSPIKKGDLLLFTDPNGQNALQTVTRTDATTVYFDSNANDHVRLQPAERAGRIDHADSRRRRFRSSACSCGRTTSTARWRTSRT